VPKLHLHVGHPGNDGAYFNVAEWVKIPAYGIGVVGTKAELKKDRARERHIACVIVAGCLALRARSQRSPNQRILHFFF
jgi:hypothetical protein